MGRAFPGNPNPIAVVVLAGGQATRLGGGDKCRRTVGGVSIIERALTCLLPQADFMVLSANGPPERFDDLGLTVIGDGGTERSGPLGGLLSAMGWLAEHHPSIPFLVSAPADCPFLPTDLVERLEAARIREASEIAMASSAGQIHPIAALWPLTLKRALAEQLGGIGSRSVLSFASNYRVAIEEFDSEPVDPFFNVNTPDDLATAQKLAML